MRGRGRQTVRISGRWCYQGVIRSDEGTFCMRPRPVREVAYWSSQLPQKWKADSGARVPVSRQKFSYRGGGVNVGGK